MSDRGWEGVARWVRVSGLSHHERNGAGRVSRAPAPWSPMISDHESRAWTRGLVWSPIMSAMGPDECHAVRVRGDALDGLP